MRAASMIVLSIFCKLAMKIIIYIPLYIQRMTKSTGIIGWLPIVYSYPGLKIRISSGKAPWGAKKDFQRIPMTTVEMTVGR